MAAAAVASLPSSATAPAAHPPPHAYSSPQRMPTSASSRCVAGGSPAPDSVGGSRGLPRDTVGSRGAIRLGALAPTAPPRPPPPPAVAHGHPSGHPQKEEEEEGELSEMPRGSGASSWGYAPPLSHDPRGGGGCVLALPLYYRCICTLSLLVITPHHVRDANQRRRCGVATHLQLRRAFSVSSARARLAAAGARPPPPRRAGTAPPPPAPCAAARSPRPAPPASSCVHRVPSAGCEGEGERDTPLPSGGRW
jgi:hypothetical protein